MPVRKSRPSTGLALILGTFAVLASMPASAAVLLQFGFGPSQTALKLSPDNTPPAGVAANSWVGVPDAPFGKSGVGGGGVDGAMGFEASSLVDQVRHFDLSLALDGSHAAVLDGVALTFCPNACGGGGTPGSTTPGTLAVKVGGTAVGSSNVTVNDTGWRSLSFTGLARAIGVGQAQLVSVEFVPSAGGALGQQWRIDNVVLDGTVTDPNAAQRKVPLPGWALLLLAGGLLASARRRRA